MAEGKGAGVSNWAGISGYLGSSVGLLTIQGRPLRGAVNSRLWQSSSRRAQWLVLSPVDERSSATPRLAQGVCCAGLPGRQSRYQDGRVARRTS